MDGKVKPRITASRTTGARSGARKVVPIRRQINRSLLSPLPDIVTGHVARCSECAARWDVLMEHVRTLAPGVCPTSSTFQRPVSHWRAARG